MQVEARNWQLAEAAGDAMPDGVPEFLSRVRWDAGAVRDDLQIDDLQAYLAERLGASDGVLVLDETGFPEKGTRSAGMQRQAFGRGEVGLDPSEVR